MFMNGCHIKILKKNLKVLGTKVKLVQKLLKSNTKI